MNNIKEVIIMLGEKMLSLENQIANIEEGFAVCGYSKEDLKEMRKEYLVIEKTYLSLCDECKKLNISLK